MQPSLKLIVLACAVAVCAAAPTVAAASQPQAPTATLAGSVLPSVARSTLLGHTSAAASVRVELILRPAHAGLLAKMAARSSGQAGLSQKVLNRLFRPAPFVRGQIAAYMRARGFRPAGAGVLTQSFTGTAAQAEGAFGVSLNNYRLADGTNYRAPSGAIHLPPTLASHVITVDGLNTQALQHPAGILHATHGIHPAGATPQITPADCAAADTFQGVNGGYQPGDLAASDAYNSAPLLSANDDGTGERVALVEFSGYHKADQAAYQSCYGLSVPVTQANVAGGNTNTSGGDEVDLDQEVAASAAPDLDHIYTYVAPGSSSQAAIFDAILKGRASTGVRIVSDSWGSCEDLILASDQAANDRELQLMAVAGISVYVASGDFGSSDCTPFGVSGLFLQDPAVQPYATGVGGTTLDTGIAQGNANHEVVWNQGNAGSGGGVSLAFLKPAWQVGTGVIEAGRSSKTFCGGKTHYCREVPDISFDADPATGYIIFCTVASCSGSPGWTLIGGTSAAAPLMAAFTADANEYSRGHSGHRLGFANPFLYHEFGADPSLFHDVTVGNNNIAGGSKYPAGTGYDMATGLGSLNADELAIDLAARAASTPVIASTKITASASRNPISPGHGTILSGKLTNTTTHTALGGRVVWVEGTTSGHLEFFRLHTGRHGGWALNVTTKILKKKFRWHAAYVGEQGHAPAVSPWRTLGVK